MKRPVTAVLALMLAGCQHAAEPAVTPVPSSMSTEIGPTNPVIFDAVKTAEEVTGGTAFDVSMVGEHYRVRCLGGGEVAVRDIAPNLESTEAPIPPWRMLDETREERDRADTLLGYARISIADAIDAATAIIPGKVVAARIDSSSANQVRFDITIDVDGTEYVVAIDGVTGRRL